MAIEPSPTVKAIGPKPIGEILWLAVTVVEFAVIMGIVCWPLSAELLPRLATGAASANRSVSVAPATSPSTDAAPSPTYSVNRLPLPDASPPGVDLAVAVEGFSGGAVTPTVGAQAGSSGVEPSLGGPAPATRRPQQARSDSATRKKPASPSRPAPTLTPPTARDSGW
jgi:hypothetical protein